MVGWCSSGRHSKCWFSIQTPDSIGGYGVIDGHRWVCSCPCHQEQGYPACDGDHAVLPRAFTRAVSATVQLNLS
jgi:hypothetical protein